VPDARITGTRPLPGLPVDPKSRPNLTDDNHDGSVGGFGGAHDVNSTAQAAVTASTSDVTPELRPV
jgi:hypothetical protein